MRRTTIIYESGQSSRPVRAALKVIGYIIIIGVSGAIGFYAGLRSAPTSPHANERSAQVDQSTQQSIRTDIHVGTRLNSTSAPHDDSPLIASKQLTRSQTSSRETLRDGLKRGTPKTTAFEAPTTSRLKPSSETSMETSTEALTCEDLESTLDQLTREREQLALSRAQLKQTQAELREALKLSESQAQITGGTTAIGLMINEPGQELHLPFLICLVDQTAVDVIKTRDLVAAQGVLLGEILEPDPKRAGCFRVLPITSPRFSVEVKLAQTGVRGVAVGLGDQMGEEIINPVIRLKYLERSTPAIVGEIAHLVAHSSTQARRRDNETREYEREKYILPLLVVGEVVSAHIRENGLFQEASLTSPLRRESVKWVSVISLREPTQ